MPWEKVLRDIKIKFGLWVTLDERQDPVDFCSGPSKVKVAVTKI